MKKAMKKRRFLDLMDDIEKRVYKLIIRERDEYI
jgi:hypothetical protein